MAKTSKKSRKAKIDLSSQRRIASLIIPSSVTIIGTGVFGGWVAVFAAKAGVSEIILVNHAGKWKKRSRDVEGREIAAGPFEDSHFGAAKVDALEELISRSNPNVTVIKHKITFDPDSDFDLVKGVIFNGVSNQQVHMAIWDGCISREIPCFSGGYNGVTFSSHTDPPVGMNIGGDLPVWVGSGVISAALAFQSACEQPLAYIGDGSDFSKSKAKMRQAIKGAGDDL